MRHARITLAIACHLTLVAPAGAGTIGVPGDFPTIQDAIDAAGGGDEIVVSAGRYVETIDLLGKQITIRSTDPADPAVVAATVVDAAGLGSTVTSARSEGPATTLDGLTITGGHAKFGGGIVVRNGSRPTIRRCVVVGNEGSAGGGMFVGETADPFVTGTVFRLNTTFSGGDGAGVLCDETSPSFIDCRFEENVAECCGGGMLLTGGSSPLVSGCHFEGNRASSVGSSGGAIGIEEGSPTIKQTTFIDNEADAGGAVSSVEGAPVFSDCRFESNDATLGGGYWSFASTPIVQDTVFTENQATCGGGMYARFGTVTLEQCEFGANAAIGGDGGAGVFAWSLELTVERTTFADNVADFGGGGLYAHEATGLVSVCTFEGNAAIDQGGAICMEGGGPAITLATF
ncbi:MAG: hypothetical protein HKN62_11070, partial [Phycisphaerales bacterium]|nr:hypothetical protein [Phycisphaerales bacterium]